MKNLIPLSFLMIVLIFAGCKSSDVSNNNTRSSRMYQQQNYNIPANVIEKAQGLSSDEVNIIYGYALDMSNLQCERLGSEVTLRNNTNEAKGKIEELDPKIEELQLEIDQYLYGNTTRLQAYQQAVYNEMNKCRWVEGEWK